VVEFSNPFLEQLRNMAADEATPLFVGADLTKEPQEPVVCVQKQGYLVQVTNEHLQEATVCPVRVLSDEEAEANRAAAQERDRQYVTQTTMRLATAHPALAPVIDHHSPENTGYGLYCMGCDAGAYADDSPQWPCSTIELILDGLGPHMQPPPAVACGKRYMDGRNEVRCWLPEAHDGECK
jgi:hypothetical protein